MSTYRHPDPAVREAMDRLRAERDAARNQRDTLKTAAEEARRGLAEDASPMSLVVVLDAALDAAETLGGES